MMLIIIGFEYTARIVMSLINYFLLLSAYGCLVDRYKFPLRIFHYNMSSSWWDVRNEDA